VFIVQAYQISQYVVPSGGIFLGNWRISFAGDSDGKMNVQSACALNTQYNYNEQVKHDEMDMTCRMNRERVMGIGYWWESQKERENWEDLDVGGKIILSWRNRLGWYGLYPSRLGQGFSEHGKEPSRTIKCLEILD
jgi:hypothetical protein